MSSADSLGVNAARSSPPTVVDVAQLAGVSRQTVSNVINAPDRVAKATRERVEAAIAELGYVPHRAARNLRRRSTGLLGYQFHFDRSGAINHVMDRFLHELCAAARDVDHQVLLVTPDPGQDEVDFLYEMVATRSIDGVVLADTVEGDDRITGLAERGVPFAAFGRSGVDAPHLRVDVDGQAGIAAAVRHLVSQGHEQVGFVGWPGGSATGDRRVAGWEEALLEAGLAPDPDLLFRGPDGPHTGAAAVREWHAADHMPTAVVTATDAIAIGAMRAGQEAGLAVGTFGELSVIGHDDTPVGPLLSPALSTIRQPMAAVARELVSRLVAFTAERRDDPRAAMPDREVLFPPELVLRHSG